MCAANPIQRHSDRLLVLNGKIRYIFVGLIYHVIESAMPPLGYREDRTPTAEQQFGEKIFYSTRAGYQFLCQKGCTIPANRPLSQTLWKWVSITPGPDVHLKTRNFYICMYTVLQFNVTLCLIRLVKTTQQYASALKPSNNVLRFTMLKPQGVKARYIAYDH
jgi:hypothetical protein